METRYPARRAEHRIRRRTALASVAVAVLLGTLQPAAAEEVLRAVSAFPKPVEFSQSFLRFVDKVNAMGKGVVRINFMGGPEVIPPTQQADAVRRGVVDMQYGPGTYYLGDMPEVDAWVGSTVSPAQARESDGFKVMQDAYAKKLGAHLLGHFDSGINFYIYMTKEPKRGADGGIDLTGVKLRSQPIYRELFTALNATSVSIPVPEVYTGLERNVVDGIGWPLVGVLDLSWDRFLKYRIEPGFFQGDLAVILNPRKWESLPPQAREVLEKAAVEHEMESYARVKEIGAATDQKAQAAGMKVVPVADPAKFREQAYETAWARLKASGSPNYDALRAAYYRK